MKRWAFYKEGYSWHKIGVLAAIAKEKKERGKWRKKTYYSTHRKPDIRLKMHIRKSSKANYSFAYNPGQDQEIERLGGGESLAHYLYKQTINELENTTLKISNLNVNIKIKVLSSETEKRIFTGDNYYDIDVFWKFQSDSLYQLQWDGTVGIEVHKSNPVPENKCNDLRAVGVPIVEVDVNKYLAYRTPEEYSTPDTESKYLDYLKPRLSEYIWVKALNDPKSKCYLEKENSSLLNKLEDANKQLNDAMHALAEEQSITKKLERSLSTLQEKFDAQATDLRLQKDTVLLFKGMNVFRFAWQKISGR